MHSWTSPLQERLKSLTAQHQIPGMALAIAQNGETLFEAGIGLRDVERQLPVTPETVFGIASVTKSFSTLAVMQLADAGKLRVDDLIVKWLPEFRLRGTNQHEQITIHHLMTHTSGMPGQRALFHARAGTARLDPNRHRLGLAIDPFKVETIRSYQELMILMAETEIELLGAPGECFNYSNEGYALLQGIIERASGRHFLSYMQERVLDPLGMSSSTFLASDLDRFAEVTELYASTMTDGKKQIFHAPVWWDCADIYTNGALKSNVKDLLRYLEIYRTDGLYGGERIVSAEAIRQMTTPHVTLPTGRQYGYGLDVQLDYYGNTLIGHGGGIKGVSSHVLLAREQGISAVVLTNLANQPSEQLCLEGMNAALGLPTGAPRRDFPSYQPAPGEMSRFAGLYRSEEGGAGRIVEKEGTLHLEMMGQLVPTRPFAADGIVSLDGATPIRFLQDKEGQVTGLFMGSRVLGRVADKKGASA